MTENMTVNVYKIHNYGSPVKIDTSRGERQWMDSTPHKFAYRCLPLSIANQHGWCFYLNEPVTFYWDGTDSIEGVKIAEDPYTVSSVFGSGIVTFHINHLVKPPPGYNLYISGAPNHFIPDIQPLTGIYEADWAPYSFTMNWKIITPYVEITFTPEDPICFFFPIQRNLIEQFDIKLLDLDENRELKNQYEMFNDSRRKFIDDLKYVTNPSEGWQKHYFQGKLPDGTKCPVDHKTKLNLQSPKE